MNRWVKIFLMVASLLPCISFAQKDALVGFYKGTIEGSKWYPYNCDENIYAEIAKFPGGYTLRLLSDVMARSEAHITLKGLKAGNNEIMLKDAGAWRLNGTINPKAFSLTARHGKDNVKMSFARLNIVSPTMGKKAPKGAVVLNSPSQWVHSQGVPCVWKVVEGAMVSAPQIVDGKRKDGSIYTKQVFGALRMHLEFKLPAEYDKGFGRGNSGLYFGPYEIQILDSFGDEGAFGHCGSIYRISPPRVNACVEPEAWQTYDVEFYPAKYEGDKLLSNPLITVWHNGVRIHHLEEIPRATVLGKWLKDFKHPKGKMHIHLQDHNHPVMFRNIWVQEL